MHNGPLSDPLRGFQKCVFEEARTYGTPANLPHADFFSPKMKKIEYSTLSIPHCSDLKVGHAHWLGAVLLHDLFRAAVSVT